MVKELTLWLHLLLKTLNFFDIQISTVKISKFENLKDSKIENPLKFQNLKTYKIKIWKLLKNQNLKIVKNSKFDTLLKFENVKNR